MYASLNLTWIHRYRTDMCICTYFLVKGDTVITTVRRPFLKNSNNVLCRCGILTCKTNVATVQSASTYMHQYVHRGWLNLQSQQNSLCKRICKYSEIQIKKYFIFAQFLITNPEKNNHILNMPLIPEVTNGE